MSTLTTSQIRNDYKLTRSDAVAIKDRSPEGVATYKSGEAYKARAARRDKQGNGLNAVPRLCGWHVGKHGATNHTVNEPALHMNVAEPAVAVKSSTKKPQAEKLAEKTKFPARLKK